MRATRVGYQFQGSTTPNPLQPHILVTIEMAKELNLAKSTAGKDGLVKDLDELLACDLFSRLEIAESAVGGSESRARQKEVSTRF